MMHGARERLREHWDARYATFSLDESGCLGAGAGLSRMIYRAKEAALKRALCRAGFSRDQRFRVLDMACGFGYFGGFYRASFPEATYTGVDLSARAIAHARKTMPDADFYSDDVVTWRDPLGTRFDVIQAVDVLQLLIDDRAFDDAVRTLAVHLAAGGVLLIPLVFSDAPPPESHHRVRSRAYFDRLIHTLGLEVVDEAPVYFWIVDGGPANRLARAVFARLGPYALYLVDRVALLFSLVNRHPDHVLSRARLLTIRRAPHQGATDRGSRASGN